MIEAASETLPIDSARMSNITALSVCAAVRLWAAVSLAASCSPTSPANTPDVSVAAIGSAPCIAVAGCSVTVNGSDPSTPMSRAHVSVSVSD